MLAILFQKPSTFAFFPGYNTFPYPIHLEYKCQDPCVNCAERADYLKIGCKANPKECKLKQEQLRAIEVRTWFKTINYSLLG